MSCQKQNCSEHTFQRGFTVVELMVAMVIGLLLSSAIYGLFSQSAAQHRTSSATGDMWQQARLAMVILERDIAMAGFGMNINGCQSILAYDSRLSGSTKTYTAYPIQAIAQTTGYTNNAMTLTIRYGNSDTTGMPSTSISDIPATTAASLKVSDNTGMAVGQVILAKMPSLGMCALFQITNCNGAGGQTGKICTTTANDNIVHNSGASGYYNPPNGFTGLDPAITTNDLHNAALYNLGTGDNTHIYSISNSSTIGGIVDDTPTLMMQAINGTSANLSSRQPVARGIVALQVLFGLDVNGDGIVDTYEQPDSTWFTSGNANEIKARQIRTARIAMLARTTIIDRNYQSPASFTLFPNIVYNVPANERNYRHALFVSEIPLRNMIWN